MQLASIAVKTASREALLELMLDTQTGRLYSVIGTQRAEIVPAASTTLGRL